MRLSGFVGGGWDMGLIRVLGGGDLGWESGLVVGLLVVGEIDCGTYCGDVWFECMMDEAEILHLGDWLFSRLGGG